MLYFLNLLVVSSEFIYVSIDSTKLLQLTSNSYKLSLIFYNFHKPLNLVISFILLLLFLNLLLLIPYHLLVAQIPEYLFRCVRCLYISLC